LNNGRSKKICNLCSSISDVLTKSYSLNTVQLEEDFFHETRLIAFAASIEGYKLCWYLNNYLKVNFRRCPQMDIAMEVSSVPKRKSSGNLFDELLPVKTEIHFPVYQCLFPFSEANILIYANKIEGNVLLPDIKQADFLMLMQYSHFILQYEDYPKFIESVPGVTWVTDVDIETLRWKKNLVI
jgi:hypothetical protein